MYDLVHARLVLVHVPQRLKALSTMIGALKPGGWLLLEEADPSLQPLACLDGHGQAEALANKLKLAFRAFMAERGVDLSFGRKSPRLLRMPAFWTCKLMSTFLSAVSLSTGSSVRPSSKSASN